MASECQSIFVLFVLFINLDISWLFFTSHIRAVTCDNPSVVLFDSQTRTAKMCEKTSGHALLGVALCCYVLHPTRQHLTPELLTHQTHECMASCFSLCRIDQLKVWEPTLNQLYQLQGRRCQEPEFHHVSSFELMEIAKVDPLSEAGNAFLVARNSSVFLGMLMQDAATVDVLSPGVPLRLVTCTVEEMQETERHTARENIVHTHLKDDIGWQKQRARKFENVAEPHENKKRNNVSLDEALYYLKHVKIISTCLMSLPNLSQAKRWVDLAWRVAPWWTLLMLFCLTSLLTVPDFPVCLVRWFLENHHWASDFETWRSRGAALHCIFWGDRCGCERLRFGRGERLVPTGPKAGGGLAKRQLNWWRSWRSRRSWHANEFVQIYWLISSL